MGIFRKLLSSLGMYTGEAKLNINHINGQDNRRRWLAPMPAASRLLEILNSEPDFAKIINRYQNKFTLIRVALCGNEIRAMGFRADAIDHGHAVFDPYWSIDGTFHFLVVDGKEISLLIREINGLQYDPYDPEWCWTHSLSAEDAVELQGNHRPLH